MRVLLVKMSSMGDVFHTFPALTDALAAIPNLQVDWVVEKSFAEIPAWHPAVQNVYAIELRKWRRHPFKYRQEINTFFRDLQQTSYDLILDAQGLLKSAWVIRKMQGRKVGFDWSSARESWASLFYDVKISVAKNQHAIWRLRELFSKALGYALPNRDNVEYGLSMDAWQCLPNLAMPYAVFLHGTTWETKLWPEANWIELGAQLGKQHLKVVLPWGTEEEHKRAERLAQRMRIQSENDQAWVPEAKLSLNEMARCLKFAKVVVSVDTGLSHVAAALDVPMIVLYRVTDPEKVGALGVQVQHLTSPIASQYLKKFRSQEQQVASLQGLSVLNVLKACKWRQKRESV